MEAAVHQSLSRSPWIPNRRREHPWLEGSAMTEHSHPQFAVSNHHSLAEDAHVLWQQIRHSKEQQTFSASSDRAALSVPTPAVWRSCSQAAPSLGFTHTHSHTNWSPTVVRVYQHLVTSGKDAAS